MAGSKDIFDPWDGGQGTYADEVHVTEHRTHSRLLGANGQPLPYRKPEPVGFRLTKSDKVIKEPT